MIPLGFLARRIETPADTVPGGGDPGGEPTWSGALSTEGEALSVNTGSEVWVELNWGNNGSTTIAVGAYTADGLRSISHAASGSAFFPDDTTPHHFIVPFPAGQPSASLRLVLTRAGGVVLDGTTSTWVAGGADYANLGDPFVIEGAANAFVLDLDASWDAIETNGTGWTADIYLID
jgi:hypothetical protein